jgi:hypothetical protein
MKTGNVDIRQLLIPAIGGAMLLMNLHFNSRIQNCEAQNEALEKEMWRLLLIMDEELTDLGYYVNDHVKGHHSPIKKSSPFSKTPVDDNLKSE